MRMGRDEAIDIFRKWLEDGAKVRVQGSFSDFAFGLWGRILSVTPAELKLRSHETDSELVLKLCPELEFGYGDNRIVTGEEKKFSECIVVFVGQDEQDHIALAALTLS